MVRSIALARHMEFSKPSICHAVKVLKQGGFLTMDGDGYIHLTDEGREVAESIYEKHQFFTDSLIEMGVDPKQVEADTLPGYTFTILPRYAVLPRTGEPSKKANGLSIDKLVSRC